MEIRTETYSKYYTKDRVVDIYIPEGKPDNLVFLFIHGGGWYAGSRTGWAENARYYCQRGHLCFSADYRLVPEHIYPAQIEDTRLVMSYIKERIGQYGIEDPRYVLVGSSAGGHLIALLSTIDEHDNLGITEEVKVRGTKPHVAICYCPVTSLNIWKDCPENIVKCIEDFLGARENETPGLYEGASPLNRITGTEPEFLFLHGSKDETIPFWQSTKMHDALLEAGVNSRVEILEGEGHGFGYGIKTQGQRAAISRIDRLILHFAGI